jgi:hypothetical protein
MGLNAALRDGSMPPDEVRKRKQAIDIKIAERIARSGAEKELTEKIHSTLRGRAKEILLSMVRFGHAARSEIEEIESAWSLLAREFAGSVGPSVVKQSGKWDQIKNHLKAVEQNETQLTRKQLDKIISDYETDKPSDEELKTYIKHVKERLIVAT